MRARPHTKARTAATGRCPLLLIILLVTSFLCGRATAQMTNAIPLDSIGTAPQSGTLANGVNWSVNVGSWHPPGQGYIFTPGTSPQTWTFDQNVSLRFSVAGLNCPGECLDLPLASTVETLHPNHSWNPTLGRLCGGAGTPPTGQSFFTIAAPVSDLQLSAINQPSCGRGLRLLEVTSIPSPGGPGGSNPVRIPIMGPLGLVLMSLVLGTMVWRGHARDAHH